jgi:hypothetical protein
MTSSLMRKFCSTVTANLCASLDDFGALRAGPLISLVPSDKKDDEEQDSQTKDDRDQQKGRNDYL